MFIEENRMLIEKPYKTFIHFPGKLLSISSILDEVELADEDILMLENKVISKSIGNYYELVEEGLCMHCHDKQV